MAGEDETEADEQEDQEEPVRRAIISRR